MLKALYVDNKELPRHSLIFIACILQFKVLRLNSFLHSITGVYHEALIVFIFEIERALIISGYPN
jgi:hypothetical protein